MGILQAALLCRSRLPTVRAKAKEGTKGREAKATRQDQKGKGPERASSQTPSEKNRDDKQVCRLHLTGKSPRFAADCKYKHNPVCRMFNKGKCTNGTNCQYPNIEGPVSSLRLKIRPSPRVKQKAEAKPSPNGSPGVAAGSREPGAQCHEQTATVMLRVIGGSVLCCRGRGWMAQILFAKEVAPRQRHHGRAVCRRAIFGHHQV